MCFCIDYKLVEIYSRSISSIFSSYLAEYSLKEYFQLDTLTIKMNSEKVVFILGDKLPTLYDGDIAIYSVVQGPKTQKM